MPPPASPLLLAQVADAGAYRRVLCVKLALDGKPAAEIARVLGWNPQLGPARLGPLSASRARWPCSAARAAGAATPT